MDGPGVGRTFFYSFATIAVLVGVVNVINVISIQHNEGGHSLFGPVIGEGSSWLSLILFLWIPWLAWRLAPPLRRPRWKLLLHIPAAIAFAAAHVALFDLLRVLAYGLVGKHYEIGSFPAQLQYEAAKDVIAYVLFNNFSVSTLGQNFTQVVFAFKVTPPLVVRGLVIAVVIGMIGGFLPAIRAARLPVTTALREL